MSIAIVGCRLCLRERERETGRLGRAVVYMYVRLGPVFVTHVHTFTVGIENVVYDATKALGTHKNKQAHC